MRPFFLAVCSCIVCWLPLTLMSPQALGLAARCKAPSRLPLTNLKSDWQDRLALRVPAAALTLRLDGGMGRKTTEADRYVKKRKAFEERDERAQAVKKAEDDEVAQQVRGLPLEDRLQYAFQEEPEEEGEQQEEEEDAYADDTDDSGDIDEKIKDGWESEKISMPVPTEDIDTEIDRGAMQDCVGSHRLRTAWCSGDAWAGLFFDLEARHEAVRVKALALASHLYRREKHVCINIFARNTSALGGTAGFAVYTNSLCGLALRWPSQGITRKAKSAGDVDFLGLEIGNATSGIVAGGVALGEVTDADEHIRIRAGYCAPVTGQDHPFEEEDLERDPTNVRAFVGEVIYELAGSSDPSAASPVPKKKKKKKKKEEPPHSPGAH